jgi:hypothetical protein
LPLFSYINNKSLVGVDPKDFINFRVIIIIWDEDPKLVSVALFSPAGTSGASRASRIPRAVLSMSVVYPFVPPFLILLD